MEITTDIYIAKNNCYENSNCFYKQQIMLGNYVSLTAQSTVVCKSLKHHNITIETSWNRKKTKCINPETLNVDKIVALFDFELYELISYTPELFIILFIIS